MTSIWSNSYNLMNTSKLFSIGNLNNPSLPDAIGLLTPVPNHEHLIYAVE